LSESEQLQVDECYVETKLKQYNYPFIEKPNELINSIKELAELLGFPQETIDNYNQLKIQNVITWQYE
jgi:hypothetical protein